MSFQSRFKIAASCLSVASALAFPVSANAETFNWTGLGDAKNLFGSGTITDGYLANWNANLTSTFPTLGDFIISSTVAGSGGNSLALATNRTIRSLAFNGAFTNNLTITNLESGTGTRTLTFGEAGATIISLGTTGASTVTFGASTAVALGYSGFGTIDVGAGGLLQFSSSAISGAGGLIKTGEGTLSFTNSGTSNTFTGGFQILGGTVLLTTPGQLGALPSSAKADAVVINGGTLAYNSSVTTTSGTNRGFSIGAATIDVSTDSNFTITGIIGDLSGYAGKLTKTGAGTLTLTTSTNTFSGGLEILGGVVSVNSMARLGSVAALNNSAVVVNGGTLRFTALATGGEDTSVVNRGFLVGSSVGTFEVQSTYQRMISGIIADVAGQAGVLRKTGTGTLYLNGDSANTFTGATEILEGILEVNNPNKLSNNVLLNGGTLWLATNSTTASAATRSFTIGSNNGSIQVTSGYTKRIYGNIANASGQVGALTLTGSGILGLSGNLTYTGGTTIESGMTLRLDGYNTLGGAGSAALNVQSGGTLNGSGVINSGATFANGAFLRFGTYSSTGSLTSDVGTFTFAGNVDISAAAAAASPSFFFDLATTDASDKAILTSGVLSIGSGLLGLSDFSFTAQTGFDAGTYTLFSSTQTISGTLLTSDIAGLVGGRDSVLKISDDGFSVQLLVGAVSAVPEPATWAAIFGGAALSIAVVRRRKTNAI